MKQAITFGLLVGVGIVSLVTFRLVVDQSLVVNQTADQSAAVATAVQTTASALSLAKQEALIAAQLKTTAGQVVNVALRDKLILLSNQLVDTNCKLQLSLGGACGIIGSTTATSLNISYVATSSINAAHLIVVDVSEDTDGVNVLEFTVEAKNTAIKITELPVTIGVTGATKLNAVINQASLTAKGQEYSESVTVGTASGTVIFDGLNIEIPANTKQTFVVTVDVNNIQAGPFDVGDTLKVQITDANRNAIKVVDAAGGNLPTASRKGVAVGGPHEFALAGLSVKLVSVATSVSPGVSVNDDIGLFTIRFQVGAIGEDVYLPSVAGANGVQFLVDRAGVSVSTGVNAVLSNLTDNTKTAAGLYKIEEGASETFELTATVQLPAAGVAGAYRTTLTGIKWGTADNVVLPNVHNTGLEYLKTSYLVLN